MESRRLGGIMVVIGILSLPACSSFQKIDMSAEDNSLDRIKTGSTIRVTKKQGEEAEFVVQNKDQVKIYGDKEQIRLADIQKLEVKEINNKRTFMLTSVAVGVLFNPIVGLGLVLLSYMFISP